MGGWKLEVFKMALYMSFPVALFHWFNQPEYFEKWVIYVILVQNLQILDSFFAGNSNKTRIISSRKSGTKGTYREHNSKGSRKARYKVARST